MPLPCSVCFSLSLENWKGIQLNIPPQYFLIQLSAWGISLIFRKECLRTDLRIFNFVTFKVRDEKLAGKIRFLLTRFIWSMRTQMYSYVLLYAAVAHKLSSFPFRPNRKKIENVLDWEQEKKRRLLLPNCEMAREIGKQAQGTSFQDSCAWIADTQRDKRCSIDGVRQEWKSCRTNIVHRT